MHGKYFTSLDNSFCSSIIRAIHTDQQPHEWAISWNTTRAFPDPSHGGNFFFTDYGICVQNAPNTLIAWKPKKCHGTSLQKVNPALKATDSRQAGLAIVTSNQLPAAWRKYWAGKMSKADVICHLMKCEETEASVSYGPPA
jgi:hypothetical protein